jgi:hypothetical protein
MIHSQQITALIGIIATKTANSTYTFFTLRSRLADFASEALMSLYTRQDKFPILTVRSHTHEMCHGCHHRPTISRQKHPAQYHL